MQVRRQIGLIGFGSVGKQLFTTLLENGFQQEDIYIFADDITQGTNRYAFDDFKHPQFRQLSFIPTLGYLSKHIKLKLLNFLLENGYDIFTFIHPTAFVSKNASIGRGVIIYPLCNIDQGATIDDGAILLNSCVVAHDTYVGKCVYMAPGVVLSGFIRVEELSFIGTGAVVANHVVVGKESIVAIGTCVTKSIAPESNVIGNPFQYKQKIVLI